MYNYYNPFRNTGEYHIEDPNQNPPQHHQENLVQQNLSRFEAFKLKYFAIREVAAKKFMTSFYAGLNYFFLLLHLLLMLRAYTEGPRISDSVLVLSSILNFSVFFIRLYKFYVGVKYVQEKTLLLSLNVITLVLSIAFYFWGILLTKNKIMNIDPSYTKFHNTTVEDEIFSNSTSHYYVFYNATSYDYRKFYNARIIEQLRLLFRNELYVSEALVSIHMFNAIAFAFCVIWTFIRLTFKRRRESGVMQIEPVNNVEPVNEVVPDNPPGVNPIYIVHAGPGPSARRKKSILSSFRSTCSTISEHTEISSTECSSGTSSYTHDTKGETITIGNFDPSIIKGESSKGSAKNLTNYKNGSKPIGDTLVKLFHPIYVSDETAECSKNTSISENAKSTSVKMEKLSTDHKEEEDKVNVQEFMIENKTEKSSNEEKKNGQESEQNPPNIKEPEAGPSGLQLSNVVKYKIKNGECNLEMKGKTNEEKNNDFEKKTRN